MGGFSRLFRKKAHPKLQSATTGSPFPPIKSQNHDHTLPLIKYMSTNPYDASLLDMGELNQIHSKPESPPPQKSCEVIDHNHELPWVIDVLLYPMNLSGLTVFSLLVLAPAIFSAVTISLWMMGGILKPLLAVALTIGCVGIIGTVVLVLYLIWYVGECITDSAQGGRRVPDIAGRVPSLTDMVMKSFHFIFCLALFAVPLSLLWYTGHIKRPLLLLLTVSSGCILPMVILAVVIFNSLSVINPLMIIRSVLKVLGPYTLFVGTLVSIAISAYVLIQSPLCQTIRHMLGFYIWPVLYIVGSYLLLVFGHILGRFYFHYHDKLQWLD